MKRRQQTKQGESYIIIPQIFGVNISSSRKEMSFLGSTRKIQNSARARYYGNLCSTMAKAHNYNLEALNDVKKFQEAIGELLTIYIDDIVSSS